MAEPFNYMQGFKQPDLAADFLKGMQIGELSRQRALETEKLRQQALLAEQKRKEQEAMQAEVSEVAANPTLEGMRRLAIKHPSLSEPYKKIMESLSEDQKTNTRQQAWTVFAALESGRKDIAIESLTKLEQAARNAGQTGAADGAKFQRELLENEETGEAGDKAVLLGAGTMLASIDPENYTKYMAERRAQAKEPSLLKTAQAEAKIKANEAEGIIAPKFVETEDGIMQWDTTEGKLVPTGYKPKKTAGVSVNLGTPQFAIEESTGEQVIYQPMATGGAQIIRGLRPVTEESKVSAKDTAKFDKLASVIDIARKTLGKASGSLVGAGTAAAQRAVGISSETTKANSKMKALQAAMMMNMPRMEGPQSDKDVQLYREQAGQIGDPTVPIEDRLAALDTLAELMDRYKGTGKKAKAAKPEGAASVDELMQLLGK